MNQKYLLLTAYLLIWLFLAIAPTYRQDWFLENILVFIAFPVILWGERRFGFSILSAWMLFFFFVLHAIGAHYTYSETPWFDTITRIFGFERNHFDRVTHFLFGFLLFVPFYELFASFATSKRRLLAFTILFMIAASGFYEVLEWIATEMTNPELGSAFLGTQGDEWDAQKDMFTCYAGTFLAAVVWRTRLTGNRP